MNILTLLSYGFSKAKNRLTGSTATPKIETELSFSDVIREININGTFLKIEDFESSIACIGIAEELNKDDYNIEKIPFKPGDRIIDIGANVGIVSLYIAKRHPEVTIYSFEPIPENYRHFLKNIELNCVTNVIPHNVAVTGDGRELRMIAHLASNSGGGTAHLANMHLPNHRYYMVPSVTLDSIFEKHDITRCRLLKIDCEGSEHEVLMNSSLLSRIEYLSGEFHINSYLRDFGYTVKELKKHCGKFIPNKNIKITEVKMAE